MVTSHDVAKLAGVSQATVSRALRKTPGTSPATLSKVQSAAAQLGYIPSEAGRVLSTQQTRRIGIVAGELTNPFYPELIEPMRSELELQGFSPLLIPNTHESPAEVEVLVNGSIDGVLYATASHYSTVPAALHKRGVPFVLVNRIVDSGVYDQCTFDNYGGAAEAAEYLADLGHTHIGQICGPLHTSTGQERALGFQGALSNLGIVISEANFTHGEYSYEHGYQSALKMLSDGNRPTAIFCGNDVIAFGALNAIHRIQRDIPRLKVEVVGFDDIKMSSWESFNLTTVRGNLSEMARTSVKLLMNRIENPGSAPQQMTLPTALVVR